MRTRKGVKVDEDGGVGKGRERINVSKEMAVEAAELVFDSSLERDQLFGEALPKRRGRVSAKNEQKNIPKDDVRNSKSNKTHEKRVGSVQPSERVSKIVPEGDLNNRERELDDIKIPANKPRKGDPKYKDEGKSHKQNGETHETRNTVRNTEANYERDDIHRNSGLEKSMHGKQSSRKIRVASVVVQGLGGPMNPNPSESKEGNPNPGNTSKRISIVNRISNVQDDNIDVTRRSPRKSLVNNDNLTKLGNHKYVNRQEISSITSDEGKIHCPPDKRNNFPATDIHFCDYDVYPTHRSCLYKTMLTFLILSSLLSGYFMSNTVYKNHSILCAVLSMVSFHLTKSLVPIMSLRFKNRNLSGNDLNKYPSPRISEGLGLVPGVVFVAVVILCQPLFFRDQTQKLLEYNAGLLCICFMILLGFVDDVVELPWRYKMILPFLGCIPLLMAYNGGVNVLLPEFFASNCRHPCIIYLGSAYYVYMVAVAVFCTNSINIYAGVNGLEIGQSMIMSTFICIHNIMEITRFHPLDHFLGIETFSVFGGTAQHFFSLTLSSVFLASSAGLLCYNWYPSSVFVGDTYTYFAGMYFAVVGVLGHFSKTLLLFFIPQILNFVISIPQLLQLLQCPRHRIPTYNPGTDLLHASPNWTLINVFLRIFGPMHEAKLVRSLLLFQVLCGCVGLFIRYSPLYTVFL